MRVASPAAAHSKEAQERAVVRNRMPRISCSFVEKTSFEELSQFCNDYHLMCQLWLLSNCSLSDPSQSVAVYTWVEACTAP